MGVCGKKIVLAASNSESSEYEQKAWSQMLLATLPARYTRAFHVNWPRPNELAPDGQWQSHDVEKRPAWHPDR